MQVKVNINYLDLLELIKQLPARELNRLKQDMKAILVPPPTSSLRISSLRGQLSKQSDQEIDTQLYNLRDYLIS